MHADYLIRKDRDRSFDQYGRLGPFIFNYEATELFTQIDHADKSIILYGKVIDSRNAALTPREIAADLLAAENMTELLAYSRYLAGRYVILFRVKEELWVLPDATSSVPVYYTVTGHETVVASSQKRIADVLGFELSASAVKIKASAEEQQSLPYDSAMYDEMKAVIPNHYLNVNEQRAVRHFPSYKMQEKTVEEVALETIHLTQNVVDNYMAERELIIPLTAGKDSRLVLSFFRKYQDRIKLYTFNHHPESPEPDDIRIPKQLTEKLGLTYRVFPREQLEESDYKHYQTMFSGTQNKRILENALTLKKSEYRDQSFVTGDIIPLVKSNFGRKLPEKLATPSYLVTKTHNYSKENKARITEWLNEVKGSAHENQVSLYDLFFWEMRLGRWLPNNMANYDTMSDPVLIFNNRHLIESWSAIPRAKRVDTAIHEMIIAKQWPELLDISLTSGGGLANALTQQSYVYYLATFLKYGVHKFKK
ncbi:hypothetical protein SAMN04488102_10385 [Alkalibacterium subtropicum]|uniref:Asparagine synthetase domain-containing protein n=2 Tax=Alkalibacterium subtropicum TaxID=753702 RepID=A0A1I1GHS4_9LACT|nr:hypothetical protein SAMN04488102_10385 [Alkalibacterium subtropicum]